jgi:hypothetical protein
VIALFQSVLGRLTRVTGDSHRPPRSGCAILEERVREPIARDTLERVRTGALVERTLARLRADFPLVENFPVVMLVPVIAPPAFAASTNRRYRLLDCWVSIGERGRRRRVDLDHRNRPQIRPLGNIDRLASGDRVPHRGRGSRGCPSGASGGDDVAGGFCFASFPPSCFPASRSADEGRCADEPTEGVEGVGDQPVVGPLAALLAG